MEDFAVAVPRNAFDFMVELTVEKIRLALANFRSMLSQLKARAMRLHSQQKSQEARKLHRELDSFEHVQ
jgi:hypothetical protein